MKLYTIHSLIWQSQKQETWEAEGIALSYVIRPEYRYVRLRCVNRDGNTILADFTHYKDAMIYATTHNERVAFKFLKPYEPEPSDGEAGRNQGVQDD